MSEIDIASLNLRIVPTEAIVLHESHDPKRVATLIERLQADGLLINPPVVAQHGQIYVLLDGATRLTAFRQLGYPHIVVQVVDLAEEGVQLHTWYHAVRGSGADALLDLLQGVEGLSLIEMAPNGASRAAAHQVWDGLRRSNELAILHLADQRRYLLQADRRLVHDPLDVLSRMVTRYIAWGVVARTLTTDVDALKDQYADLCGLVVFPQFTPETILDMATEGRVMPAGITRFIVPGRVLRLNVPLEKLRSEELLADKTIWLDRFIQRKLAGRKVRYYQEPVVLMDE